MTKLRNFLIFFILVASILCMTVYAYDPELQFDPDAPYYEITPSAIHAIVADEIQGAGHVWQWGDRYILTTNFDRFQEIVCNNRMYHECFRLDTRYKDQPSLREHWNTYTEDFFEDYVLLRMETKTWYYKETGDATPAPEITHIYLQGNTLWVSSRRLIIRGETLSSGDIGPTSIRQSSHGEYHIFIAIKKEEFRKLNVDIDSLSEDGHSLGCVYYDNPNTGDTSLRSLALPLIAVSLASASVAWCAKKKKRA